MFGDHVAYCLQAFSHPISANHPHPVERLAREVQQLKDKLALAESTSSDANSPAKRAESRRADTNLNQNTNNGTFLFPASRPLGLGVTREVPAPTSSNHQTSRGPPTASAPPARTSSKHNGGNKHTFLFGHSSVTEARPDQRYYPAPNNAKLPKSNASSVAS